LTVGEIVANDFRAAEIFKNAGIDFCCGGKKNLDEACREVKIDKDNILDQLDSLNDAPIFYSKNYKEWDPGFLSDYIINAHHRFVKKNLPELVFYTQKIALVHSGHHPELEEVASLFDQINNELLQHLKNEEEVLFPAIKEVVTINSEKSKKVIVSEIERMIGEHEFAGSAMDTINKITDGYKVPEDGCNTYRVAFGLLKQFEDDLHIHVHLENNILFPKALKLAE
jgi:regulator of cell morphogenesis and NO signaling